jgi:hypothetical protein
MKEGWLVAGRLTAFRQRCGELWAGQLFDTGEDGNKLSRTAGRQ